jgi:tripartite-type tricarboxylate transporter receptor subunit TctC
VIENKPGAFGIVAIEEMLRAKPDGYTLMVGNPSTNAITPLLYAKRMTADYQKSVMVVARLVDLPSLLLANAKAFPTETLADVLAFAKANPGKVRYGTAGVGSHPHYNMELLAQQAGVELAHIPNKGGGAAYVKDIMNGDVQIGTMNVATAGPALKTGLVRALATTEETRLAEHPDVPAYPEFGFRGLGTSFWHTMFAPSAAPHPVIETLHAAVLEAMRAPAVIETFNKNGMRRIPHPTLAEEQEWLRREIESWQGVIAKVPIETAE